MTKDDLLCLNKCGGNGYIFAQSSNMRLKENVCLLLISYKSFFRK